MRWIRALRLLTEAGSAVVAPHVAARLAEVTGTNERWLIESTGVLTPAQLAGTAALPDPLPLTEGALTRFDPRSLSAIERRLLLVAALASSEHVALLVDAVAVDADRLLSPPLFDLLRIRDGFFDLDPAARAAVVGTATRAERSSAHEALARSSRRMRAPMYSAWHRAHHDVLNRSEVSALLQLAALQLSRGTVHSAQRVADAAASAASHIGSSGLQAAALETAATAALASGCTHDARRLIQSAAGIETTARRIRTATAIAVVAGPGSAGHEALIAQVDALAGVLTAPADLAAAHRLHDILDAWQADPDGADRLAADLAVGTVRARPEWRTRRGGRTPSPAIAAFVRLVQATLQFSGGDPRAAARTVEDAAARLPMALPGPGAVNGALDAVAEHLPGGGASVRRAMRRLVPASAPMLEPTASGRRTVLASSWEGSDALPSQSRAHALSAGLAILTARERDVVGLLLAGGTARDVAAHLNLSPRTVETHIAKAYRKLGVGSRAELLSVAHRDAVAAAGRVEAVPGCR